MNPDPLTIRWQGREVRVRHDDERLTPYSPAVAANCCSAASENSSLRP